MARPKDGWMTQQYAHEAFEYVDGELFWKARPLSHFASEPAQRTFNARRPGKKAGTPTDGYMEIRMAKSGVKVHRIVFVMHHGYLPDEVDHIDGNTMNNRIENLRAANRSQNMHNTRTQRRSKTGVKGVSIKGGKFCAFIKTNKKQIHLGMFDRLEDAAQARKQAEKKYHGEYANDR
jgi:hypothetical protein